MASTPSDFDENMANEFRPKNEKELLEIILSFLDEMNVDLVFTSNRLKNKLIKFTTFNISGFEELRVVTFYWISKMSLKNFDTTEIAKLVDKIGRR